jgi:uncharacterized protein YdhG (YjbR/CyaY superfamily)
MSGGGQGRAPGVPDPEVDAYLDALGPEHRAGLADLRATLRELLPEAEECMSYGVPGYRVHGAVVAGFAAAKGHLSYFPHSGSVLPRVADELSEYSWAKGTLRFPVGSTLPRPLVRRLLDLRLAQVRAAHHPG